MDFSITLSGVLMFPIWSFLFYIFATLQVFSHDSDSISCTWLNELQRVLALEEHMSWLVLCREICFFRELERFQILAKTLILLACSFFPRPLLQWLPIPAGGQTIWCCFAFRLSPVPRPPHQGLGRERGRVESLSAATSFSTCTVCCGTKKVSENQCSLLSRVWECSGASPALLQILLFILLLPLQTGLALLGFPATAAATVEGRYTFLLCSLLN